ncbi:ribbon-helix-helix domain-containing protein [Vibrio kasasachensis]|uniref:ribbon-helix-helix domain-containing protein n=1 Tax=Vibrio kasasachensis TaxID=2910248 RepID=UPI003D0AD8CA
MCRRGMCSRFNYMDKNNLLVRSRSIRILGHSTSLRIESKYWDVLESIADKENKTRSELISEIYSEAIESGVDYNSFTSLLRVYCIVFLENESFTE